MDPISRWVRYYRRRAVCEAAQTLHTFATLTLKNPISGADGETTSEQTTASFAANIKKMFASLEDSLNPNILVDPDFDQHLQQTLDASLQRFSESLTGNLSSPHTPCAGPAQEKPTGEGLTHAGPAHGVCRLPSTTGYLLANPCSFSQRLGVDLPELATTPEIAEPVLAADENTAVVDLPGMGFAWIDASADMQFSPKAGEKKGWLFGKKHKTLPPMAEENTLRNEFFEVTFDPYTGAIRAISDYRMPASATGPANRPANASRRRTRSDERRPLFDHVGR